MQNPYQVLGLPDHSNFTDIRKKYLLLVKKYHPDNGGNEQDFTKITQAYNILISKLKPDDKNNNEFVKNNISKKNNFVKDIKVNIPISKFLLGPTLEIVLGSDKKNKPVTINISNTLRNIFTEVEWDNMKKNINVKVIPKSTKIYKVIDDYHLLVKCFMDNNDYEMSGQISVPYPTGINVAVFLKVKPSEEPLQMFKGLGLPMKNGEKGNMIIQFINKEKRFDALNSSYTDTGIPVGMPISIESIIR